MKSIQSKQIVQRATQIVLAAVVAASLTVASMAQADLLYVSGPGGVWAYDSSSGASDGFISLPGANFYAGIAFDNNGNFYVPSFTNNTISKFNPYGASVGIFASTGLYNPVSVAFDSSGNLYAANWANTTNAIHKFGPTGVDLGTFTTSTVVPAFGLAIDSNDNVYMDTIYWPIVQEFSPSGSSVRILTDYISQNHTSYDAIFGMALDSSNNVYTAGTRVNPGGTFGDSTIHKFASTGADLGTFVTTGTNSPSSFYDAAYALAFDSSGNLYANLPGHGTIQKYDPNGNLLGSFASAPSFFMAFNRGWTPGPAASVQTSAGGSYTNVHYASSGALGNSASILDGTASSDTTVTIQPVSATVASSFTVSPGRPLVSEVVQVSGTSNDTFVLEMSYNPSALAQYKIDPINLRLAWYSPALSNWANSVDGNTGGTPNFVGDMAYDSSLFSLGNYGVDTVDHEVWAVINHNSYFSVFGFAETIPEPSTLALLGLVGLLLLRRHRKD